MNGEQFVIHISTVGDKETVAAQQRVTRSTTEMGAAAKAATASSAAGAQTLAQKWSGAGASLTATGKKINRNVSLPILAIGAVSGKMAIDFEKSMRNVNSIAQLPEPAFKRLNKEVLAMAGPVAQAPKTLSEGLYDLVSSGFDSKESMTILGASARAATAGLTTTEVSTKAVAAALNAYRRPAGDARQVSDDLFQTVNLGVVSFDELASTIGYVLPAAATMKINLKEVGASISTLTKEGQSGSNAVTNINAAITSFIKPTKDMKSILGELGYETSLQLVKQKGFQGAIELVSKAVHGNKEEIGKLFPNVRAMRAVFGLTGDNIRSANEDLRGFQSDTGATSKVLREQSKSLSYQWNQLKAEASVLAINVGNKLVPSFRSLAHTGADVITFFTDLPQGVQSTILKVATFGLVLGPVVRIAGTFTTAIGGLIKAGAALKGISLLGDMGAALSLAKGGEMGGFSMLGKGMATSVIGGLKTGLPIAAAGAGLGNIIYSATKGDWEQVGFKGGGALIGGIAGAFLGPQGAMLGAGAGSFVGGLVGKLFEHDSTDAFKRHTQETVKAAVAGHHQLVASSRQVAKAERHLADIGQDQTRNQRRVKAAQDRLNESRKSGDTGRIRHDEARLNELKAKQIVLINRQYRAETQLHVANVKNAEDARRARAVEVALIQRRQVQFEQAQKHERVMRKAFDAAVLGNKTLKEQNERERDLIDAQKRRKGASEKLKGAEKELGGTMKEITEKFGDKFADQLRKQLPLWTQTANQSRDSVRAMHKLVPAIKPITEVFETFAQRGKDASGKVQRSTKELADKAPPNLQKAGRGYTNLANTGTRGLEVLGNNTNSMSKLFGGPELNFALQSAGKGHAGGGMMRVQGHGMQDTVPLVGPGGIRAMVAPGEDLIVANRHQRRELDFAVASTYRDRGMRGFFNRSRRPHHMAQGGIAKDSRGQIPEPHIAGAEPLRSVGQGALHRTDVQAEAWLRKHMGPRPGLGTFDGHPVSAWIIPILTWARAHGWGGSVTSGHRDAAEQIAAATGYGLSKYGPGGPLASNHTKVNFPGGAVDVSEAAQLAAILKGYPGKPNLVWGGPVMGDFVHFSATGHQRGGILRHMAEGGFLSTAYGPPWEGIQGTGTTATGVDLTGSPHKYIVAVDPSVIPLHTMLQIHPNPFHTTEPFGAEDTGGEIKGKRIDFYDWRGRASQNAWGRRSVSIDRMGSGSADETVPPTFHGVRTKPLHFGAVPKNLEGLKREIAQRVGEMHRYRAALKAASNKPKTAQALKQNITALEGRLNELRRALALERREAAKRKVTKRLTRKLGSVTGIERRIEEAERAYNIASQGAEQIVGLEPQSPEEEGEAAEKAYVKALTDHIEGRERPAYTQVLNTLASWRDITLMGERHASKLEGGWEGEARGIAGEITAINKLNKSVNQDIAAFQKAHPGAPLPDGLKKRVAEQHRALAKLPVLKFRDREVRKFLGEAREAFYGGRKNPLEPPRAPMPGSGSFEDTLINIQGTHWPDQHSPQSPLPGKPVAGMFGGAIFDTQQAIDALGLKVNQAVHGAGGGGGNEADTERLQLLEEENARLRREQLVQELQAPVLANYLGKFGKGGLLPSDGYYYGHAGERLTPRDQDRGDLDTVVLEPHIHVSDELAPYISATVEQRFRKGGRQVGQGMSTPGAAGRRARFTQKGGRS